MPLFQSWRPVQFRASYTADRPQQFRTFEIHINSDYTVPIETLNVDDPSAAEFPIPYHASCNAELLKPLSAEMVLHLRKTFRFAN